MVTLFNNCNLNIVFNPSNNELIFDDEMLHRDETDVSLNSILPTLLNKTLNNPRTVYNENFSVYNLLHSHLVECEVSHDIVYLPSGLLGIEYMKSRIYYSPEESSGGEIDSLIEVLFGTLTLILQQNRQKDDEFGYDTIVNEGYLVKVSQGGKFIIPKGYYYTFVNTSEFPVVFVRLNKKTSPLNTPFLQREGGLAYFCIRKNAKPEIVHNPRYKYTPGIVKTTPDKFIGERYELPESSLYELLVNKSEYLEEMLCTCCY